ncbi:MCE family protein [Amycolatopsis aidingensis]|uniref:MCE family protein n=1 Tax=Amycolatopsis aidingensis TaxID=2842453 RepID=UPI001C0CE6D1|nr:MCE family protein [Amycolatopsis aidingensis]
MSPAGTRKGLRAGITLTILAVLLAAATVLIIRPGGQQRFTAYFTAAVGLYPGSTVRVLGIPVGTVAEVVPEGERVRVELAVDSDVPIPEGASAAVVAPSLVSDRYVQFVPVYTQGPKLASGAVIPVQRTVTPAELDELFASLDELAGALGPDGANSDGALSDLLDTLAENADGNGKLINDTISKLAAANQTLSGTRDELFGTVSSLQEFTSMLAGNDDQVVEFARQLADISAFLSGERTELGAAVSELATALESVRGFIKDNRGHLKSNVDKLVEITKVLVDQRDSLAEALDTAPNAVENFYQGYNPQRRTLDSRTLLLEWWPQSQQDSGAPEDAPALPLPPVGPAYSTGGS